VSAVHVEATRVFVQVGRSYFENIGQPAAKGLAQSGNANEISWAQQPACNNDFEVPIPVEFRDLLSACLRCNNSSSFVWPGCCSAHGACSAMSRDHAVARLPLQVVVRVARLRTIASPRLAVNGDELREG
jgi:hypothetical protein